MLKFCTRVEFSCKMDVYGRSLSLMEQYWGLSLVFVRGGLCSLFIPGQFTLI